MSVRPTMAVGALAFAADGRLLVIQRGEPPNQGLYSLPGGKVEPGETLVSALVREVREETGLEVAVGPLVELLERIGHDDAGALAYHFVIADYLCEVSGGVLAAASDAADARFVTRAELDALPTTSALKPVVDRAIALRGTPAV